MLFFAGNAGDLFRDAAQMILTAAYTIPAHGGDHCRSPARAIGAASGQQTDHRSVREACPFDRSQRESRRANRHGTRSRPTTAHPAGGRRGPTRARTKEGATSRASRPRNKDTTTNSRGGQAHTRPGRDQTRESSHTRSSTRRAGPGAASRSQTHRDANKRTRKQTRKTTGRETTDRRTRTQTITTGRETPTPTDRESTNATAGSPQRTGATEAWGLAGSGLTKKERAPAGRPQTREPSIKGIADRQQKATPPCDGRQRRRASKAAQCGQRAPAYRPRAPRSLV